MRLPSGDLAGWAPKRIDCSLLGGKGRRGGEGGKCGGEGGGEGGALSFFVECSHEFLVSPITH